MVLTSNLEALDGLSEKQVQKLQQTHTQTQKLTSVSS